MPAAPTATDLDQQHVIDDLFDADRMSWEIVEYFDATYHNADVDWRGEVSSYNSFRHDSDFGAGPGVKASILLGSTGRSGYISNEVHAIVQFPEGTELERGGTVEFRGTLVRVDRFSRKLYVQYATLTV